jgi:FtsP/CotA-like multicopper oxidase with cupredoxin domain
LSFPEHEETAVNARVTTREFRILASLLALALPLGAGTAAAATYDLVAMPFTMPMPGGPVTMWGYAIDGSNPVPTVPGPALVVPPGDSTLTINLRNTLPEPVSVVISGQALPTNAAGTVTLSPAKFTDEQGRQRVRSFTAEAGEINGTQTYTWSNLKSGTYLYHSGSHAQVQVQMGLYGAMTHDAAAGQAYANVSYDSQVTILLSEIDPVRHAAVAADRYRKPVPDPLPEGLTAADYPSSTINYAPTYFLINGQPHTNASVPLPAGSVGQTTLVRLLNAGLQNRAPVLHGQHMRLVAEDGKAYPYAREQYSAFLPALKTVDGLIVLTAVGDYPLYDRRLGTTNPTASGSTAGGMLTFLQVAAAGSEAPLAAGDAYTTNEDTPLTIAAPGVLGNDDTETTAVLVSAPIHGALSLNAGGGFTYTPQTNYNGADSFTYQARNGGGIGSAPATVSLTINPVNDVPVAANDAYTVAVGNTLNVGAPGVLGNDSDVDGNPLTAVNASNLTGLTFSTNGSFTYNATTAGTKTFTYRASDGTATSAQATVTITVTGSQAPVAMNDTASAPMRKPGTYTPVVISVLANDTDPNNNIVASSVNITAAPNMGGAVTVNANGTVSYTPALRYKGSENFSYRVRDATGLWSNTATVRVNVK